MSAQMFSTPQRNLKRARSIANSSDTDYTPPQKKPCRERARFGKRSDSDLENLLRLRVRDPTDDTVMSDLQALNNKEQDMIHAMQKIADSVKATVKQGIQEDGQKILEVELYLRWLKGFDFVLTAMETALDAKVPGTRRRVPGLGRLSFSVLYHLLDTFIDEVNAHQDGWSFRFPAGPIEFDPLIMSLAEESNDSSMDTRSEDAVKAAELILSRYDTVLFAAVRRYKSECNKKLMAVGIGRKEESLARGCCLLSEQTGYGGTDDMGFRLLVKAREAMMQWKTDFEHTSRRD